jgi:hypothetical protein
MNEIRHWMTLCESRYAESAPPGEKAEHFIKKHKKEFKKRYGKKWSSYLYGTAWKKFSEGSLRDYLSLVETTQ